MKLFLITILFQIITTLIVSGQVWDEESVQYDFNKSPMDILINIISDSTYTIRRNTDFRNYTNVEGETIKNILDITPYKDYLQNDTIVNTKFIVTISLNIDKKTNVKFLRIKKKGVRKWGWNLHKIWALFSFPIYWEDYNKDPFNKKELLFVKSVVERLEKI